MLTLTYTKSPWSPELPHGHTEPANVDDDRGIRVIPVSTLFEYCASFLKATRRQLQEERKNCISLNGRAFSAILNISIAVFDIHCRGRGK